MSAGKKTVSTKVENIFAHAVALEQSGRLKNTIHASPEEIIVLNSDNTVMLHFPLVAGDSKITGHVSFKASDYDSNAFTTEGDSIVFHQKSGDIARKKICKTAEATFDEIAGLWDDYQAKAKKEEVAAKITLGSSILTLLEEGLSHMEFSAEEGRIIIRQRDIYSGTIIELTKQGGGGFGVTEKDRASEDFGPVGLRTSDFMALFAFNDSATLVFYEGGGFCTLAAPNYKMRGIISLCLYDDMGDTEQSLETHKEKGNGRKEPQERGREQGVDRQTEGKARCRVRK